MNTNKTFLTCIIIIEIILIIIVVIVFVKMLLKLKAKPNLKSKKLNEVDAALERELKHNSELN